MTPKFLQVVVDLPVASPLDYATPESCASRELVGRRCVVPLGRRRALGLITATASSTLVDASRIKRVERVLDEIPALDEPWLAFTRFAADYYQHAWGEVAIPALPPTLRQVPGPRYMHSLSRLRKFSFSDSAPPSSPPVKNSEQSEAVERIVQLL